MPTRTKGAPARRRSRAVQSVLESTGHKTMRKALPRVGSPIQKPKKKIGRHAPR